MRTESIFNLQSFSPNAQYGLVLSLLEGLRDGESFLFVSDLDPSVLCHQIDALQAPSLQWEYVKKSAGDWKVRVNKVKAEDIVMNEAGGCCGMCGGETHG